MPLLPPALAMCLAALTIPAIHTAPAPLGRRLLQTCPDGQTWVNNACYCNPGTRDGTLVNPLMLCNGNNTLCPWRLWRGVPNRVGHVSGAFWPYQYFNLGVDDNTWSTFQATCSTAAPAEVTVDMQTSYKIASMNLWAGVTNYAAVPGVLTDSIDATNYAYTSNMDIRLGNSIFNMTTCYSSGTLLSIAATFTTSAVRITSCNNITARYINISIRGNGAGFCGFRDLQIRAYAPSTESTCQGCPENKYCRLNQTYDCPLATPVASVNSASCTCASNMFLDGANCIPLPGYTRPFIFTFDTSLLSPYPIISSSLSTDKIQLSASTNCLSGKCVECWTGAPPFGRIFYSSFNSFYLTVGFYTRSSPVGMSEDNIITFFTSLTSASASTWQPSGGYAGIDLVKRYGASSTTLSFRSNTPTTIFPWLSVELSSGPIQTTRYHWTFVLNKTTLTMYVNTNRLGAISGIVWGAEYPRLTMFGGSQFYDSLIILPVALTDTQVTTFVKDSLAGRDMGGYPCMANFYCMNGTVNACPGNLISEVGSSRISHCYCRQPDMINYNVTYCICNTFRKFNNVTFGVCQNCPGSPTYVSCSVGRYSKYEVSLECSDYFCTLCPIGFYNNVTNATICTACPPGKFITTLGATVCTNCAIGTFNPSTGLSTCTACRTGTFMSTTGASVCTNCSAGTYQILTSTSFCTPCETGKYSTASAGTRCDLCVTGKYNALTGRTSNVCLNCTAGSYANTNGLSVCTASPTGSYTSNPGSTMFTACPTGTFSSILGQSTCLQCRAGTFTSIISTITCTNCAPGTYASTTGLVLCTGCISGKFSTLSASITEANCTNCPAGRFTQFPGTSACSNCSVGYFNTDPGSSVCAQCSLDTYTDIGGKTTCTQCALGSQITSSPTVSALFVADQTNFVIRSVSLDNGSVTTVAGSGVSNTIDGRGRAAAFRSISALTLSYDQSLLYVADFYCVRSMTTKDNNYTVRTVVGLCGTTADSYGSVSVARLGTLSALCVDPDGGGLYIADSSSKIKYFDFTTQTLRHFASRGIGGAAQDGFGTSSNFNLPRGLYMSRNKTFMLVAYSFGIFHVNLSTTYARYIVGSPVATGSAVGIGTAATFSFTTDITMNSQETMIYAIDQSNARIRSITYPQLNAQFLSPNTISMLNLAMAPDGVRLFYDDATTIRFFNLTSVATIGTVFSGSGTAGFVDGSKTTARFRSLIGMRLAILTSTSCIQCTAGSFRNSSFTQCLNCNPGTFSQANGASTCTACPSGKYASASRSTACIFSPIGSYAVEASSFYTLCQPGTFAPTQGSSTCTGCPPGSYLPDIQSTACAVCSPGDYSQGNVAVCSFCATGTYTSQSEATVCDSCIPGAYLTSERGTVCLSCDAGSFSLTAASVCSSCSPGTYSSGDSATVCQSCQAGLYAPTQLATQCLICQAGTYSLDTASECLHCNPGFYNPTGSASACLLCQEGAYSSTPQATQCLLCPPGQHASTPATSACLLCNEGTYASTPGTVNCSKCSVCIAANTGLQKTCPRGATVNNVTCGCASGFYGISGDCNPCPANTQTLVAAAESLLDCRCLPGYVCSYTKRINVRLTLKNITWDMLDVNGIANSPIIEAIAAAAGVPKESVIINGIVAVPPGRRMLHPIVQEEKPASDAQDNPPDSFDIWATVLGANSLNDALATTLLDPYLIDSLSWTHGHSVRVAREWGSLM